MSSHKEADENSRQVFWTGYSGDLAGRAFHWNTDAPQDGESGYMEGAFWIATDQVRLYINAGSGTSAHWLTITLS